MLRSKSILVDQFICCFFFFNDTATTEIYTLSLHDALPISKEMADGTPPERYQKARRRRYPVRHSSARRAVTARSARGDRKSTRLNSSHSQTSYAVFCLKKKKPDFSTLRQPSR